MRIYGIAQIKAVLAV